MLTTRRAQSERLGQLIKENLKNYKQFLMIDITLVSILGYGIWVNIRGFERYFTVALLLTLILIIPGVCTLKEYIGLLKAKKSLLENNYSYYYIPIDNIEASTSGSLRAHFKYKEAYCSDICNNYKASRVHVFDCKGYVISNVEDKLDLLK